MFEKAPKMSTHKVIFVCLCMILFVQDSFEEWTFHDSNRNNDRNRNGWLPADSEAEGYNNQERCITTRGRPGNCQPISSCPWASRFRFRRRNRPRICYWIYDEPVICCPRRRSSGESPTTQQPPKDSTNNGLCGMRGGSAEEHDGPNNSGNSWWRFRTTRSIRFGKLDTRPNWYYDDSARNSYGSTRYHPYYRPTTVEPLPLAPSMIVGGRESTPRGWPWMAALFTKTNSGEVGRFLCGASLISKRHILTAAHCFDVTNRTLDPSKYVVFLGAHKVRGNPRDGRPFNVENIKVHHRYRRGQHYNDIALLKLTKDAFDGDSIAPVCLPDENDAREDLTGKPTVVTGWGDLSYGGVNSKVLQEVTLPVMSNSNCSSSYVKVTKRAFPKGIDDSLLCAGYPSGGKDACQGDSGGPLVLKKGSKGAWIQIGIVSFGHGCASSGYPGVYTRVSRFRSWIKEHAGV